MTLSDTDRLERLTAENARLEAEVGQLREKVDELEVTLDDEECSNVEFVETWRMTKAENARLRAAVAALAEACREGIDLLKGQAYEARQADLYSTANCISLTAQKLAVALAGSGPATTEATNEG